MVAGFTFPFKTNKDGIISHVMTSNPTPFLAWLIT